MKKHNMTEKLQTINLRKLAKPAALCISALFIISILSVFATTAVQATTYELHQRQPIHRVLSTPTPTPKPTARPTPTANPRSTATPTPIPSLTPKPTPSPTPKPIPTSSQSPSPSPQASIGIYSDQACTVALPSISWGTLSPGATSTLVLYVKNQGNTAVILSIEMSNWNPATLSTYLNLNWNYSNQTLNPGTTLKITLTLIVSPSTPVMANFGFSTTITATAS